MDKSEKLALARKKLRKYQAKGSPPTNHITEHINSHHSAPHPPTKQLKTNAEMSDNVHSQTIDILVAEKSSLKNQLSIHEMQLQTKQIELTNLQDEVKNLRSQLEKSQRDKDKLTTSLSEKSKLLSDQSTSDISLRLTLQQCNGQIEELNQQKSELTSKVNQLALQLQQVEQARLELSEKLKIYEVNNLSHQAQVADDVSANDKRKIEELEGQVATLSAAVQSAKREREQSLRDVDALRDALMENKQESARKIGDLQTQLKESQLHLSSLNQRLSFHQQQDANTQKLYNGDIHSKEQALVESQQEIQNLHQQIQQLTGSNQQLGVLLSSAEERGVQLEEELNKVKTELVDQQVLLSSVSNDKETLSRAMSQNKELKKNLQELEEAFVSRTNQNAELLSSLETEGRRREKLEREKLEMEKDVSIERQRVTQLMLQVEEMKQLKDNHHDPPDDEVDTNELSVKCQTLQEERDKLLEELRNLSTSINNNQSLPVESAPDDESIHPSILQQSFTALQEHFVSVMHEKAELEDKLQESEHRIIQLEGETETIGEYVALYQTQRMALKEKFTEKDKIIQQLLDDKRHLEIRLNEVQGLVKQLSDNRQFINGEDAWVEDKSHDQSHDLHQLNPVNQIVSRIEELTSTPLLIEGAVLQCPCCSGQLIIV